MATARKKHQLKLQLLWTERYLVFQYEHILCNVHQSIRFGWYTRDAQEARLVTQSRCNVILFASIWMGNMMHSATSRALEYGQRISIECVFAQHPHYSMLMKSCVSHWLLCIYIFPVTRSICFPWAQLLGSYAKSRQARIKNRNG